jgi:phage terminase large subunit-like protein
MNDEPSYTIEEFRTRWASVKAESAALDGLSKADEATLCEDIFPGVTDQILDELAEEFGPGAAQTIAYAWEIWGRQKQLIPITATAYEVILFCAGRGNGKTRTAAEWVVHRLEHGARVIKLVGPTESDIKEFMLGGNKKRTDGEMGSGLFDVMPPWIRYVFKEDKGVIEFPDLKAVAYLHSAMVAEVRGPEPDTIWGDEVLKWRLGEKLLSNLRLACRAVGKLEPQTFLTTSPKRLKLLRDLVMDPNVLTIHGASEENIGNVSALHYRRQVERLTNKATGRLTRQGEEELGGDLGTESDDELFPLSLIDRLRVPGHPELDRIVIGIDPSSGSDYNDTDATGIVVCGRAGGVREGEGFVLDEATKKLDWTAWADKAFELAESWGASAFVIETNYGGKSVRANLLNSSVTVKRGYEARLRPGSKDLWDVVHKETGRKIQIVEVLARGDKHGRAELVSTMYNAERVHHVGHALTALETEISEWVPSAKSPNGMDALVHAMTELFELDKPREMDGKEAMRGMSQANARFSPSTSGRGPERPAVDRERPRVSGRGGRFGGRLIG